MSGREVFDCGSGILRDRIVGAEKSGRLDEAFAMFAALNEFYTKTDNQFRPTEEEFLEAHPEIRAALIRHGKIADLNT